MEHIKQWTWTCLAYERDDACSGSTKGGGFIKGLLHDLEWNVLNIIVLTTRQLEHFGNGVYSITHEFSCIYAGVYATHTVASDPVGDAKDFPVSRMEVAVLARGELHARLGVVPWSTSYLQIHMCNSNS